MAESAAGEAFASSSKAATPKVEQNVHAHEHATISTPRLSETMPASFQAVNTRAVAENANVTANSAGQGSNALGQTPPPSGPAVAPNAAQTAQTSNKGSYAQVSSTELSSLGNAMADDSATYGTRSRNRTGNARPNYAEDQDMDLDLSSASASKKKAANDIVASAAPNTAEAKRAQDFARLIGNNDGASANESTPARGTPTIATAINPSKKRKAPGAPQTVLNQTPPVAGSPAPTNLSLKKYMPPFKGLETNIMTLTKHKSRLNKHGELIADDGTKLCVNGKPEMPLRSCLFEVAAYPASEQHIASKG